MIFNLAQAWRGEGRERGKGRERNGRKRRERGVNKKTYVLTEKFRGICIERARRSGNETQKKRKRKGERKRKVGKRKEIYKCRDWKKIFKCDKLETLQDICS